MRPTLSAGDLLLVGHGLRARSGSVVVVRLPDGVVAVKRAAEPRTTRDGRAGWWLLSDDPERGVDSRHRGPVPQTSVLAVVLVRVWPRPGRLLPAPAPPRGGEHPDGL